MTQTELDNYLLSFAGTWCSFPYDDTTAIYKFGDQSTDEGKMFALIERVSKPLRLHLKCDVQLAKVLRDTYETVLPSTKLDRATWNMVLCTGQVPDDELQDLMRLSYRLASES